MNKSEECDVVSWDLRSVHVQSHIDFLARLHSLGNLERECTEVITIGLNEESVFGPLRLTTISESPSLGEELARANRVSITKAFLDKASLVENLLLLGLFVASSLA